MLGDRWLTLVRRPKRFVSLEHKCGGGGMPNRLEMVVGERRQTALPKAPELTSRTPPSDGRPYESEPPVLI